MTLRDKPPATGEDHRQDILPQELQPYPVPVGIDG